MKFYYITFRSVTHAQRGEQLLKSQGIRCHLLRTPKWMEQRGCGYCLRVRPGDALKALEVLRRAGAPYSKLYAQTDSGKMEELPV